MGRTVRGGNRNHTPNVRPVQKVELSEKNTSQRFIAVIVLLGTSVVAAFSRGYSFMDMNMETTQISATISAKEDQTLTFGELTEMADEVVEKAMTIDGIETIGAMAGGSALSMMGSSSTDSISMYMILDEESEVSSADVIEQLDEQTKDMD